MPKTRKIFDGKNESRPLRVTVRNAYKIQRKNSSPRVFCPRTLVRCGCCNQKLEIYHDDAPTGDNNIDTLEINGVWGTVDQWRQVLMPFLNLKP